MDAEVLQTRGITSSLHHLSSTLTRPIQFKEFRVHFGVSYRWFHNLACVRILLNFPYSAYGRKYFNYENFPIGSIQIIYNQNIRRLDFWISWDFCSISIKAYGISQSLLTPHHTASDRKLGKGLGTRLNSSYIFSPCLLRTTKLFNNL